MIENVLNTLSLITFSFTALMCGFYAFRSILAYLNERKIRKIWRVKR